jgi:hypothetical protein
MACNASAIHNICEDPITGIVSLLPQNSIPRDIGRKNRFYKFCEDKISKITYKLKSSPYLPYSGSSGDPLGVNENFARATCQWLAQFPQETRMGFLFLILSVIYITKKEMDTFLDILIEKLSLTLDLKNRPIRNVISSSLSETGIYDDFVKKLGIEGTLDKDKRPWRGPLSSYLATMFSYLSAFALEGENNIYYVRDFPYIEDLIRSSLGPRNAGVSVLLIEDYTFSGGTIKSDIERLIKFIEIVFKPYEKEIKNKGYELPKFFILVPLATEEAINKIVKATAPFRDYIDNPISGYKLDNEYRALYDIPYNIQELKNILGDGLFKYLKHSLEYFHKEYAHKYWEEETNIKSRVNLREEDCIYGFAKGAWTVVTYRNTPNNSLPPLWYPHNTASDAPIYPLFRRIESRISHKSHSERIEEDIHIAVEDSKGYLERILRDFYEKRL